MKKTVLISCPTLKKELCSVMRELNVDFPVYFLPQRLHSGPAEMREYLQKLIDSFWNVDRILICVSGCGGSTAGLKATTAELVFPKTSDCIDILLSKTTVKEIVRDRHGIFLTESWMEFFRNSTLDFQKMIEASGRATAEERIKTIYSGFHDFYIIDTGKYDIEAVKQYLAPMLEVLGAELHVIEGSYEILRKLVSGNIDEDFRVIRKAL